MNKIFTFNFFRELIKNIEPHLFRYIPLSLSMYVLFFCFRLFEFILVGGRHVMPENVVLLFLLAVVHDMLVTVQVSAIFALPFLLFSFIGKKTAMAFYSIGMAIFWLSYLGLIQYFSIVFIPLGADLFGYSVSDILLTTKSSFSFSIWTLVTILIPAVIFAALVLFSKRWKIPNWFKNVYLAAAVITILLGNVLILRPNLFSNDAQYYLVVNKFAFLVTDVWDSAKRSVGEPVVKEIREYPFLHEADTTDVLGVRFNISEERPNLVFMILEGVGKSFCGRNADYGGFMPFLDSLTERSLYWENFLSTSGRTFGVLPAIFGSLPYGENGFMEMGYKMPAHLTLLRLLKGQGYYINYFYGGNANFDMKDVFLERQQVDFILDENKFGPKYSKTEPDQNNFTWGYSDGDVFRHSFEIMDEFPRNPRVDVYLTLNTHEPFIVPNNAGYLKRFETDLQKKYPSAERQEELKKYAPEFASLIYLDDMLREFFIRYEKRSEFRNTIFFITGDHRIIPIPPHTRLERFHVPLIVYSPRLIAPAKFSSVSSHLNITPTVISFLEKNYGLTFPRMVHWAAGGIDTAAEFRNTHSLPLMRNKNELVDYLDGKYFLAGDELFELGEEMDLRKIENDSVKMELEKKLARYKQLNTYVCTNDRLYPKESYSSPMELEPGDDTLFAAIDSLHLNAGELFEYARIKAFDGKYRESRTVCRKLLLNSPGYHDVRVLLGKTFAWDGKYSEARMIYKEVLRRAPNYHDAAVGLIDVEMWNDSLKNARELLVKVLALDPNNEELKTKMEKLKKRMVQ